MSGSLAGVAGLMLIVVTMTNPARGWAQTGAAPDPYREGITLLQQGRIPEAVERLRRAAEERPDAPAVWALLGQAYEAARRVPDAIDAYRRAAALAPESDESRLAARRLDQLGRDAATYEAAQRHFQAAVRTFGGRDVTAAEASLRRVLDLLPRHLPSLQLLGVILEAGGRSADAQAAWEAAVAIDPAFYPAQANLGRLYERAGNVEKAVTAYAAAVTAGGSSPDAAFAARRLSQLGSSPAQAAEVRDRLRGANDALRQGRAPDARRLFEQVLAALPTHAAASFGVALLAAKRGDTATATAALKRGLEGDPDFYPALFLLAEIEAGRGQFQEAIDHFTRVTELAGPILQGIEARRRLPSLERALTERKFLEVGLLAEARNSFNAGIEAFQLRDYESAFASFGKAMVLDEQNPYYAFNRGLAAYNIGNSLIAAKSFQRAADLLPTYSLAHFWLALLFQTSAQQARDEGNFPEAQAEYRAAAGKFQSAIEHGQQDWFLDEARTRLNDCLDFLGRFQEEAGHLAIGGALVVQGRLDEAAAEFGRAAGRFPWDFQPLLNIGAIHVDRGAYDLAKAALDRAIEISPRSPKIYIELGFLYERQERREDAIAAYRKAAELGPDAPQPRIALGTLLQQADDHPGAIAEFERALELVGGTSTPLVHFRLAFSYNLNGQLSRALTQYRRAFDLLAHRTEKEAVNLRNTVSERISTLERSLRPYTLTFHATPWSYDSNINASRTDPLGEVSTGFGGGISYRLVDTSTLHLRGGLDHNENVYLIRSQVMNTSTTLSLSTDYQLHPLVDLSAAYRWTYGHGSSGPQSIGQSMNGSVTKRGQLPSGISIGLAYGTSEGLGGSTLQGSNLGYSLSLNQSLAAQGTVSVNYGMSQIDSNRADQTTQSKSIGLSYSRTLWKVLSASWSYRVGFTDYVNPFTVADVKGGRRVESLVFRKGGSKSYGMDLSYVFRGDLTVSLGFNGIQNESNVTIDRPEDLTELLTNLVQASGAYRKHTLSFSVSKTF